MTTSHRRRMFGDVGPSAPEAWLWGGPSTPAPDILLLLYGRDVDALSQQYAALSGSYRGVSDIVKLEALTDLNGKEHFGFADGISQPTIDGLSQRKDIPPNTIQPGEFILGYVNEYGQYTGRPLLDRAAPAAGVLPLDEQGSGAADLGRNGSRPLSGTGPAPTGTGTRTPPAGRPRRAGRGPRRCQASSGHAHCPLRRAGAVAGS